MSRTLGAESSSLGQFRSQQPPSLAPGFELGWEDLSWCMTPEGGLGILHQVRGPRAALPGCWHRAGQGTGPDSGPGFRPGMGQHEGAQAPRIPGFRREGNPPWTGIHNLQGHATTGGGDVVEAPQAGLSLEQDRQQEDRNEPVHAYMFRARP
jgi:hypothetical protein